MRRTSVNIKFSKKDGQGAAAVGGSMRRFAYMALPPGTDPSAVSFPDLDVRPCAWSNKGYVSYSCFLDAIKPMEVRQIYTVELSGDFDHRFEDWPSGRGDKYASQGVIVHHVFDMKEADKVCRLWAADLAERLLREWQVKGGRPAKKYWTAIELARKMYDQVDAPSIEEIHSARNALCTTYHPSIPKQIEHFVCMVLCAGTGVHAAHAARTLRDSAVRAQSRTIPHELDRAAAPWNVGL